CALNGATGSVPDHAHSTAPDLPVVFDARTTGLPMSCVVATFPYRAPNRLLPDREARSCVHPEGADQSKSGTPASFIPPTRSIASPACTVPGTVIVKFPEVVCASADARNAIAKVTSFRAGRGQVKRWSETWARCAALPARRSSSGSTALPTTGAGDEWSHRADCDVYWRLDPPTGWEWLVTTGDHPWQDTARQSTKLL